MNPIYTSTYSFIGTVPKGVQAHEIGDAIPEKIAAQQAQVGSLYGTDKADIEVLEHAYADAEPNCWLVFARWRIKEPTK
jgi:hypothetical protein